MSQIDELRIEVICDENYTEDLEMDLGADLKAIIYKYQGKGLKITTNF